MAGWEGFLRTYRAQKAHPLYVLAMEKKQELEAALVTDAHDTQIAADYETAREAGTRPAWASFISRYKESLENSLVIEAVRRRDSLPSYSESRASDQENIERSLKLSHAEIRKISYVLFGKYGNSINGPNFVGNLSTKDREYLKTYANSLGVQESGYLTSFLVRKLLSEELPLQRRPNWESGSPRTHQDWYSMIMSANSKCEILTFATETKGWEVFYAPRMILTASSQENGSTMNFNMVTPNPFKVKNTSEVYAVVDGRRYNLQMGRPNILQGKQSIIGPRVSGNGLSGDVTKAIRRGKTVEIVGVSKIDGSKKSITFSARGFTGAFNQMMKDCNRPGLIAWIR